MSAPIRPQDTAEERLTKLLPADVTAAFLSAKAGLVAFFGDPNAAGPVFWTFLVILAICPVYFWFVTKVTNYLHIAFLCLSFTVFAISIADDQFITYLPYLKSTINVAAIVVPILWAFLVARIFVEVLGQKVAVPPPPPLVVPPDGAGG